MAREAHRFGSFACHHAQLREEVNPYHLSLRLHARDTTTIPTPTTEHHSVTTTSTPKAPPVFDKDWAGTATPPGTTAGDESGDGPSFGVATTLNVPGTNDPK
ncbi:MAG: hypothetical protein L0K43_07790 [Bifidobacterium crudilactis]|nr:hypothetical protein [Bifidobacterium crudilactis]